MTKTMETLHGHLSSTSKLGDSWSNNIIRFLNNKVSHVGTSKTHIGKKPLTLEVTIKHIHHWLKKLKQP